MVWIGDYLPSYKVAPLLARLLHLIDERGVSAVPAMAYEAANSTGPPPHTAGSTAEAQANATAEWSALRTLQLSGSEGLQTAGGNATAAASVSIDVTFVSALPPHAVDEAALTSAKAAVLSGASGAGSAAGTGMTTAQQTALSACCGDDCTLDDAGATARSARVVASLGSASVLVPCLAAQPEVQW